MTFLEKLLEDYPSANIESAIEFECPFKYGYEKIKECKVESNEYICRRCWEREMPETEPSCDEVKAAYDQGLNDAWELAKKILYGLTRCQLEEIFGTDNEKGILSDAYAPQEALAKLKAYEETQIMVGDVVEVSDRVGVVVKTGGNCANVVHDNGNVTCMVLVKDLKKTGKHIDIQSILSQIGGE